MGIDFNAERWDKIKDVYGQWWNGELDRPLIPILVNGRDPGREQPDTSYLTQGTCNDLTISPDDLVDRIDYELSRFYYLGDAFPYFNMDCFGPGVVAAFLGANPDNSTGHVWFRPQKIIPISELHFEYNPENIWLNRIKDICKAAMKRWQGNVVMGMPDLGGTLDILYTFRPGECLMMDLYDYPDEVKRLIWEIHYLWHHFYNEINDVLQPVNPGYLDWARIFSNKPCYVPQSDVSYMIGADMFDEFVLPELTATCKRLAHTIYHLDGIGQLNHLDSILRIRELDAVQWVPGDGSPGQMNWPDVYYKIKAAKKKIQLWEGFECLDTVSGQIGTRKGIHLMTQWVDISEKEAAQKRLLQYGIGE